MLLPFCSPLHCCVEKLNIEEIVSMLGKSLQRYVAFPTVLVVCVFGCLIAV